MASDRATRLRRLARSLTERFAVDGHRLGVVERVGRSAPPA
ncbi:hypothetical protein [Streptomyces sp. LN549]